MVGQVGKCGGMGEGSLWLIGRASRLSQRQLVSVPPGTHAALPSVLSLPCLPYPHPQTQDMFVCSCRLRVRPLQCRSAVSSSAAAAFNPPEIPAVPGGEVSASACPGMGRFYVTGFSSQSSNTLPMVPHLRPVLTSGTGERETERERVCVCVSRVLCPSCTQKEYYLPSLPGEACFI